MTTRHTVAVLGGGSFGTVIGNIIANNGHSVRLWLRNDGLAATINSSRENSVYLPGYHLSDRLYATTSLRESVADADIVFVAVPGKSFREVVQQLPRMISGDSQVISLTKGIEPGGFRLMSQILREELPDNPLGVLSGPNLASEIALGHVSASVIASESPSVTRCIHDLLHCEAFLIYASDDMYGVELGGALKNVYAILAGVGAALGFGENTQGMLLTRALAEMSRFAVCLGANPLTFLGLSGVGDLFVTCSSPLSRNYQVGLALGKGRPLEDILATMDQVAEGINTLGLLKREADSRGVPMPLVDGLHAILYEHREVEDVLTSIMHREQAQDVEFVIR
ncbi:NAD(P)H-dependent glycerol-3-phosphate dehydrogenase [Pseudohalioglobus lutimaris]|uniref:Glycerol-3-phosphate dehydrogenase [NAD(P)+] n=1 Tax=Pseudohalioglobus lutimaris TaxID=1737061 RepID=A0A2N5X2W5_9GAMM|nr:NAD(P)H-dependent glycerol-3-phosphate dehydrogenase [Pseudohalioglobus lutimaris]PLW68800.1 NAD(P)H-dependent glycerol-3-phosphate dehydrogenase [Pseudohalioglobus lutimaris]